MRGLPNVNVIPDYFPFRGGLDLATPDARKTPGSVFDSLNYEPTVEGGYARILGYEVLDGRASPSAATAVSVACSLTTVPAAGATLTIGAATATFIKQIANGMLVSAISGTIPTGTTITSGGNVGTTSTTLAVPYPITPEIEAGWLVDAAAYYRTLIAAVPGGGPVRGVWLYNGTIYAWRDNAASGATSCVMHRATTGGWTAVALGEEVSFTNAASTVGEGDTLTQGAASATIARVVLETGSLASGTNTGRLILTGRNANSFSAALASATGAANNITLGGVQTAITFPPGGTYRFRNFNFFGQASGFRLYGVNGVGRAFEFDGTVMVPISTKAATDTPSHIETNRSYLFLGQAGSVLYSVPGQPYRYDAVSFAGEVAVGGDITAMQALPGKALGVFTAKTSHAITGQSSTDFSLETISPDSGALPGIVSVLAETYALSNSGLVNVRAVQEYGNFSYANAGRKVQPLMDAIRTTAVTAVTARTKDQMRIFCSDGRLVHAHPVAARNAYSSGGIEFMSSQLGFTPACACSVEGSTGLERILVGASDGFVYEMDRGSTFNGAAIESYCKVSYYNTRSPSRRKHFRFAIVEMVANLFADLRVLADYSYGSPDSETSVTPSAWVLGAGGQWGVANWDQFFWGAANVATPRVRIEGSGTNVSLTFYSNTTLDFGHTLQGATVHHTPRLLQG